MLSSLAFAQEEDSENARVTENDEKGFHETIAPALRWTQEGSWQPPRVSGRSASMITLVALGQRVSPYVDAAARTRRDQRRDQRVNLCPNERWTIGAELRLDR